MSRIAGDKEISGTVDGEDANVDITEYVANLAYALMNAQAAEEIS